MFRSSVFALRYTDHDCSGHFIRAATIILGAVGLFTVYSADPRASRLIMDSAPWQYMGESAWDAAGGWSLDRSSTLAVNEALGLNDVIGANIRRAVSDAFGGSGEGAPR